MRKKIMLLVIATIFMDGKFSLASEELVKKLEEAELSNQSSWKLVYLRRILNENEQIEALDKALEDRIRENRDFSLESKLLASRTLAANERIATLEYLLASPQKKAAAFKDKILEKIEKLKAKEEEGNTELD